MPAAKKTTARKTIARKTTPKAPPKTPVAQTREEDSPPPPKAKALPPTRRRNARDADRIAVPPSDGSMPHLTATDKPGVFVNSNGAYVDSNGVLLSLAALGDAEAALDEAILGKKVETPAELMKRVALDPRLPLGMRLDAAKGAAPYYDRKTPVAVENTNVEQVVDLSALAKLPKDKRREMLELLKLIGIDLSPKAAGAA